MQPLQKPIEAIIFDCDGTLSHIEGIDELAKARNISAEVKALTAKAMGSSGLNPDLYAERLNLVLPTLQQIKTLGQQYYEHKTLDIEEVIATLSRLNKQIYIISAGLHAAVLDFAERLKINANNVFAVPIFFDEAGNYLGFDLHSPLVRELGKRVIVEQLKQKHQTLLYVGDGLNDLETYDLVTRFVGYGGAFYRQNIQAHCEFYITAPTLSPLLSLCLTEAEIAQLTQQELACLERGKGLLE